jgi:hypothetical protein
MTAEAQAHRRCHIPKEKILSAPFVGIVACQASELVFECGLDSFQLLLCGQSHDAVAGDGVIPLAVGGQLQGGHRLGRTDRYVETIQHPDGLIAVI